MNKFIEKAFKDKKLVELLLKFENATWKKFDGEQKIEVLNQLANKFNGLYKEFGECTFYFISLNKNLCGENNADGIVINIESSKNQYVILSTMIHEIRHFYQDRAYYLYKKTGAIHELFADKNYDAIFNNDNGSELFNTENYISSNENNFIEYSIQPVEFDAESFSKEFMVYLKENYLTKDKDLELCGSANLDYDYVIEMIKENKKDLVSFEKKYMLNYYDYVSYNKEIFIKDEVIAMKYKDMLNDIYSLNVFDLTTLLIPAFFEKYDNDTRVKLLKRYLELNGFEFDVQSNGSELFINNDSVSANDIFKIMELIFNEMADEEIRRILNKKNYNNLMRIEREIRLNFKSDKNLIKKEQNPLFYEVQPYMLYKNNYVLRSFYDLYRSFDSVYRKRNNFFDSYSSYIKKYDIESMIKKVEILTGEEFDDFYNQMLIKMKQRKTRK